MLDMIPDIVMDIFLALLTSYAFWYLTFIRSGTNILFSDHIVVEPCSNGHGYDQYRYRIKLVNAGIRDLIEVTSIVELLTQPFSPEATTRRISRLSLDNENFPILKGRKEQKKSGRAASKVLDLYLTDSFFEEFSKEYYSDDIRKKAAARQLTLTDIIQAHRDSVRITIYLYGNDSITGARKMFSSEYGASDIRHGTYAPTPTEHIGRVSAAKAGLKLIPQPDADNPDCTMPAAE